MRVPTLEAPKVGNRPIGADYSNLDQRTGYEEVAKGIGDLGKGIDQGLEEVERQQKEARQRAVAVDANDLVTEAQNTETLALHGNATQNPIDRAFDEGEPRGYLNTQGKDAVEQGYAAMEYLRKRHKEIADKAATPAARRLFEKRSQEMLASAARQVEDHTARETRVAEERSVYSRQASFLNWAANNYAGDETDIAGREKDITDLIGSLYHYNPDLAQAKAQEFLAKSTAARLNMYLSPSKNDWEGAEKLLATQGDRLEPSQRRVFERQIVEKRKTITAERGAAKIVEGATDAEGRVDRSKVAAGLNGIEDDEIAADTARRADTMMTRKDRDWNQKVAGHYSAAQGPFLASEFDINAIPEAEATWLKTNAPQKWKEFVERDYQRREHEKAVARSKARTRAPSTKLSPEQKMDQAKAYTKLRSDMVEDSERYAGMTIDEFNTEAGLKLSPSDLKAAATAFERLKAGDQVTSSQFTRFVTQEIGANPRLSKDKAMAAKFRQLMGDHFDQHLSQPGSKTATYEEMRKWSDESWTDRELLFGLMHKQVLKDREPAPPARTPQPYKPPSPPPDGKPTMQKRVEQLHKRGLAPGDIAKKLKLEGYTK